MCLTSGSLYLVLGGLGSIDGSVVDEDTLTTPNHVEVYEKSRRQSLNGRIFTNHNYSDPFSFLRKNKGEFSTVCFFFREWVFKTDLLCTGSVYYFDPSSGR
ncbi:MAG: hypothetical protein J3Q66DRAFT_94346 [Benniella sp.]|nr:MAG: hypothetical protein J3Q66DRAFT_94346 [Benniella sp.]